MGPDNALWITLVHAGYIARLEPDGRLDSYELDSATCRPSLLTTGPDDALWFTAMGTGQIARITTDGLLTGCPLPERGAMPSIISPLWVALEAGSAARIEI